MNILVNLPPAFHAQRLYDGCFERLRRRGALRRTSHDRPEHIAGDLRWADAVLMWSWPVLDGALLDAADGLDYLGQIDASATTARACLERGIPFSLSKRGWSQAVAEMALGLILSGLRRISAHHGAMRVGGERWGGAWPDGVDARERLLAEQRVTLVGFGGVGRTLRRLLAPFGCAVRVVDPYVDDAVLAQEGVQRGALPAVLGESDVLVLCAAANTGTRRLLGADEIAALGADAVLVNVARAHLVDTDALVARLRRGDLHACIDVFDREPLPADHPLRDCANAWLTPHRGGGILASGLRVLGWLVDDLEALLDGRERRHAFVEAMLPSLDG